MNAVGYVRLSRDENRKNYASIEAQKDIISEYAKEKGYSLINIYEDDDVSGYKFNQREGFSKMLTDIEVKPVDAIIVKDLSRLGRRNAKTLLFIEELQESNTTLIAIDDHYNSDKDDDDIIGIKTWYNERYVKDISKKIRSNIKNQMKRNMYQNSIPYGYLKDPKTKKLVIDEEVKDIIIRIFEMYLNGNGIWKIANILTSEKVDTPTEYKRKQAEKEGRIFKTITNNKWHDGTIMHILKNDVYIGTKRQHTTTRNGIHGKIQKTDEEEQYIFENNHAAIICKHDFEKVQELIEKRKDLKFRGERKFVNPYSGLLFCADCKNKMIARNQKNRPKAYVCSSYKHFGKTVCSSHYIREDELNRIIIRRLSDLSISLKTYLSELTLESYGKIKDGYSNKIEKLEKKIQTEEREYKVLISQRVKYITKSPDSENTINKQFDELEEDKLNTIEQLKKELKRLNNTRNDYQLEKIQTQNKYDIIMNMVKTNKIGRKELQLLFDKIIINKDGRAFIDTNISVPVP